MRLFISFYNVFPVIYAICSRNHIYSTDVYIETGRVRVLKSNISAMTDSQFSTSQLYKQQQEGLILM